MPTRLAAWATGAMFAMCPAAIFVGPAHAAAGQADDWQFNFQDAVTPLAAMMRDLNNLLLIVSIAIVAFVLALLLWVMLRYNEKANPEPSQTTHHTQLEIAWTVIPCLILIGIAVPSFRLLYAQYDFPPADVTIKATGHQWYWSYNYPDHGNFAFDSYMLDDKERKAGQPRLLSVDNEAVVPVGKVVHVLVTADDVIHSWAVPSFGVKVDAVPGRVTQTWFKALEPGVYYGQCSQFCGTNHAFMPITVRVVSEQDFAAWVNTAGKKKAASIPAAKVVTSETR